ncbi:phospholipase [Xanthomonas fragariae LMG 25863]|nr:phospholipase [Xanthomonas fragariae LMG 25863]
MVSIARTARSSGDYGFLITNFLRGHVQVFDGYGESLIDYKATCIGLGVSSLEWLQARLTILLGCRQAGAHDFLQLFQMLVCHAVR